MTDRIGQMHKLVDYFVGYNATRFIELGVETGLFGALAAAADGITPVALAAQQGLNAEYLRHFLQTGYALELLEQDDGHYRLAPHMAALLARPEHNSYLGALAGFHHVSGRDFDRMAQLLRSGDAYTFQQHDADFIDGVAKVTAGIAGFVVGSILPGLPELAGRDDVAVLDLGCGAGGTLLALARAYPHGRLLGVDVEPRSVEQANARLAQAGVAQRAQARLAAAESLQQEAAFDLVTLIQVLHETVPTVRAEILARAHAALKPGGLLLVVDEPYPEHVEDLRSAKSCAMTQFIERFWGNELLSLPQQKALIESAGLRVDAQSVPPPGLVSVTVARRVS
ncbi:MAG: class I SAM-dependent methyltransferase [Immundisolibacter sp.]|uniref:class I SAM-dependent methyltransferase n=1 Tax=Immundisolibacter sp. TaxID=1934948 RepID=UPI003EE131DE